MGIDFQQELRVGMEAVRRAATITTAVQRDLVSATTLEKKDKSPVTVADYASQAVVCAMLAGGPPGHRSSVAAVVGEEGSAELRLDANEALRAQVSDRVRSVLGSKHTDEEVMDLIDIGGVNPSSMVRTYWTLDPIDGTKGFPRGQHYAIALALIQDGEVVAGVLGCPKFDGPDGEPGALMVAARGAGTSLHSLGASSAERKAHVADVQSAAEGRMCESVESAHSDHSQSARIISALGVTKEPYRIDSQAKYAAVANGDASIYLRLPTRADYRECIWDHAAGMIVVQEAGGRVTDARGNKLDFSQGRKLEQNTGVIATSGAIHGEVLSAVRHELG